MRLRCRAHGVPRPNEPSMEAGRTPQGTGDGGIPGVGGGGPGGEAAPNNYGEFGAVHPTARPAAPALTRRGATD